MQSGIVFMPFLSWLWLTIIAIVISVVWWFVLKVKTSGGYWFELIVAWIGAWLGTAVFGNWVWTVNNISIIPAILGSISAIMLIDGIAKIWASSKQ
ncbi:MAG: GlsB/YeaQ/YmgE family stress response membrane protein [Calditrichaeota bacterium]|nr:GlsB/YeaQ/YmgE family stress response membrane protein [Calditrichota bacterium]